MQKEQTVQNTQMGNKQRQILDPTIPVFTRPYNLPLVEFYKFQLNFAINVPMYVLNDTYITVLAYVAIFGNSKDAKMKIIEKQILTSMNSCANYFSQLTALGYLTKVDNGYILNEKIKLVESDFNLILIIRNDLTNDGGYHPYHK